MEKSTFRLAWTSSSFLRQEYGPSTCTVRSPHAYQHPPLASKIRKCETIQLPISSVCKGVISLPLTSCISPTLAATAIPAGLSAFQWRCPFFILFCKMSNARNRARLKQNTPHTSPALSLPASLAAVRWVMAQLSAPTASGDTSPNTSSDTSSDSSFSSLASLLKAALHPEGAREGSASVSWRMDRRVVNKDHQLHLTSWFSQQFSQEV